MAECTSTGENQSYRRQSIAITRPLIIIHYRGSSQAQISADEENATKLTIKIKIEINYSRIYLRASCSKTVHDRNRIADV
ncbi:Sterol 3-beta-glucosyltransferase [Trichinella pseudospiralis]